MRRSPAIVAGGLAPSEGSASPVSLVHVPFRGGHLLATAGAYPEEGDRPIPLRPFADRLGLTLAPQLVKLKRVGWACVSIIDMQIPGDDQVRGVACLPLRALPMWLATINPSKVAPEARPMLESYQREAAEVLFKHFLAPAPAAPLNPPGTPPDVAAQLAELAARIDLQGSALAATRREVTALRMLRPGHQRGLPPGPLLPDEASAKIRAYCASRATVTSEEILVSALGCTAWNHAARMAVARELRLLSYTRRRIYTTRGRAYLYERPGRMPAAILPKKEAGQGGLRSPARGQLAAVEVRHAG